MLLTHSRTRAPIQPSTLSLLLVEGMLLALIAVGVYFYAAVVGM